MKERIPRRPVTVLEIFTTVWPYLFAVVSTLLSIAATLHAILRKPESSTIIAWVGLAWLAPIFGAVAYFCFGINRIKRKATSLEIGDTLPIPVAPVMTDEDYLIRDELLERCPGLVRLARLGENVTGKQILPGNDVTLLRDGDEAFPAMLRAIDTARHSVAMFSYIFDSDRAGEEFQRALKDAQMRGVEVRVLIDHVGARYSKHNMIDRLRSLGLEARGFLPTRRPKFFQYANLRNHRKILVVDGRTGFTGGTNIREGHALKMEPEPKVLVQCAHFQLDGPVVSHLQEVFAIDWAFASGEILQGETWFPRIERSRGLVGARGVADGPDEDFEKMLQVILGAISTASKSIRITSPYFLPDTTLVQALTIAALRGVEVDIVIPSHNNVLVVEWAAAASHVQLLEKGCRIHRSAPPFDHSKLMVIDGVWSLVGSTNWDPRSLRLNFEFNVECYSTELAGELESLIDGKIETGEPITLQQIHSRSLPVKIRDGLARLASPYL